MSGQIQLNRQADLCNLTLRYFCPVNRYHPSKQCALVEIFADFLDPYFQKKWYVRKGLSLDFKVTFEKSADWDVLSEFEKVLTHKETKTYAQLNVNDCSKILDYYGLVVSHYEKIDLDFAKKISEIQV